MLFSKHLNYLLNNIKKISKKRRNFINLIEYIILKRDLIKLLKERVIYGYNYQ